MYVFNIIFHILVILSFYFFEFNKIENDNIILVQLILDFGCVGLFIMQNEYTDLPGK